MHKMLHICHVAATLPSRGTETPGNHFRTSKNVGFYEGLSNKNKALHCLKHHSGFFLKDKSFS